MVGLRATATTSENADPTISSAATSEVAENTTAVLTVTASDADDSVTRATRSTGGADASCSSRSESSTGALSSRRHRHSQAAPNFEDAQDEASTDPVNDAGNNEYIVVVVRRPAGTDEREKSVTQTITVTVTDVAGEKPGKPGSAGGDDGVGEQGDGELERAGQRGAGDHGLRLPVPRDQGSA